MGTSVQSAGYERFIADASREINLDSSYIPHPKQYAFHSSPVKHRLLGGAAGPGKSLALIMDHLAACLEFSDPIAAGQVHTLLLRRTFPQLNGSLIPRFLEKVPKELYKSFNQSSHVVTWTNGAQTHFGAMQYDADVWNYQGAQYYKIGFDELTQFTWYQWNTISAWNRCPVDPHCTKDGATNPVGVGAMWAKSVFIDHRPPQEADDHQRATYNPADYEYFPCTYKDNPLYANDPIFIAQLDSYPGPIRDALMHGTWGALGTYFDIWDAAVHVCEPLTPEPWWPKWVSGDWGFEHEAAIYWHTLTPEGIVKTYREMLVSHQPPRQLAESIVKHSMGPDGKYEQLEPWFFFSHDAFAQKQDVNTIARQMEPILREIGVSPVSAGLDKMGGEQLMYQLLKERIKLGQVYHEEQAVDVLVPRWQVSSDCPRLIAVMPQAPRDEKKPEQIAKFNGDDPLDGCRHGIYGKFSGKIKEPVEMLVAKRVTSPDPTIRAIQAQKAQIEVRKSMVGAAVSARRWRPPTN